MAVNRFEAGIVTRTKGQNIIARAAYNAREKLEDERTGESKDYRDKGGLEFSGIFAPKGAPEWVQDRQRLWNAIEEREDESTRPDHAQLARDFKMSLPHELNADQRRKLVTDFAREMSRKGMILDVAIHAPDAHSDQRHYHAHMLVTMREIKENGFGYKVRSWNKPEELEKWKDRWSELGARYLERAGLDEEAERYRVGYKTLKEQQKEAVKRGDHDFAKTLDREPTIPLGPHGAAMKRNGKMTPRALDNEAVLARNEEKASSREPLTGTAAQIREAYRTSRNADGFVLGLAERNLHLAIVSFNDTEHGRIPVDAGEALERERAMERRGIWSAQTGGVEGLTPKQLAKAQETYERYDEARKETERRREFPDYVDFVQKKHADRVNSLEVQAKALDFADDGTDRKPRGGIFVQPGSFVVIRENGYVYKLNLRTTGEAPDRIEKFLAKLDRAKIMDVAETREAIAAERLERGVRISDKAREYVGNAQKGVRAAMAPAAVSAKALDVLSSFFEGFGAPLSPVEQQRGEDAQRQREAEGLEALRRRQREGEGRDR